MLAERTDHIETRSLRLGRDSFRRRALPRRHLEANAFHAGLRREIARPDPGGNGQVDAVVLRRDAHHFRTAPGDRTDIAINNLVRGNRLAAGLVNFIRRLLDPETENTSRFDQPVRMFLQFENFTVIDPFPFEHTAGIMQTMRKHMDVCIPPWYEFTIQPDEAVAIGKRGGIHFQAPCVIIAIIYSHLVFDSVESSRIFVTF